MPGGAGNGRYGSDQLNCTDFQSRRLNIAQGKSGEPIRPHAQRHGGGPHTALVAILENYQQADGSVVIPKCCACGQTCMIEEKGSRDFSNEAFRRE